MNDYIYGDNKEKNLQNYMRERTTEEQQERNPWCMTKRNTATEKKEKISACVLRRTALMTASTSDASHTNKAR